MTSKIVQNSYDSLLLHLLQMIKASAWTWQLLNPEKWLKIQTKAKIINKKKNKKYYESDFLTVKNNQIKQKRVPKKKKKVLSIHI